MIATLDTPLMLDNFQASMAEFEPHLANYNVVWSLLRLRARQTGYPPLKLYPLAKHFFRADKPYFRGKTTDGLLFLGDHRDRYALDRMTDPAPSDPMADFVIHRLAETGGSFLDVGCNLGLLAAHVARGSSRTEVFAFEALPETAKRAGATFGLNRLTNVNLFPLALGDADGEITFYNSPGNSDFASANPAHFDLKNVTVAWVETRVRCLRLDTIANLTGLGRVGVLKIDTEGNELRVLSGAKELIARDRPEIIFEYNFHIAPGMGWDIAAVDTLLNSIAPYSLQALYDDGTLHPLPTARETEGWMKVDIYCALM